MAVAPCLGTASSRFKSVFKYNRRILGGKSYAKIPRGGARFGQGGAQMSFDTSRTCPWGSGSLYAMTPPSLNMLCHLEKPKLSVDKGRRPRAGLRLQGVCRAREV